MAGYGQHAIVDDDLVEWNYGDYEGKTTAEIRQTRPDWQLFRDGCPGGKSPDQVGKRAADRVISGLGKVGQPVLLFLAATSSAC